MNHTHDPRPHAGGEPREPRPSRGKIAFAVFLAVALFFLLTEHRAHFFGALPYLLLLACPLMHVFHHHGGHRHRGHDHRPQARQEGTPPTREES